MFEFIKNIFRKEETTAEMPNEYYIIDNCEFRGISIYKDIEVTDVVSVYDGDTFRANLNIKCDLLSTSMPIRIFGIDTPEMRTKNKKLKKIAIEARDHLSKRLKEGHCIVLKNIRRGMYFRIIADVYIDGISIGDELLASKLARRYFGGTKRKLWDTI